MLVGSFPRFLARFGIFLGGLGLWLAPLGLVNAGETALDRYVKKADSTYSWKLVNEIKGDGYTQYVIDMKSQTWRTKEEVNRPIWEHWVIITKPERVASDKAFLFIGGGGNGGNPPQKADERAALAAKVTKTVSVELKMIPNQTLIFHGDGKERKEDDLIGYTWDQFLKTGDETWPARLPMVKGAVRAMDCVQEFMASEKAGKVTVNKFVVCGGSKRGWTTWCTAAVDGRVEAIIPAVIDVLNVNESMRHHLASYGFFTHSVGDYVRHNIMQRMNDPKLKALYEIEDPYSYRDRLTMPKFILNAAGDQFFCPDSSQFYFDELKGEKYLRYVPNTDHSLRDSDATVSLVAFYDSIVKGTKRPEYSWTFEKDGSIRVKCETPVKEVKLWYANNPKARDFRLESIGKAYQSISIEDKGNGVYIGKIEQPKSGWSAFFVELTHENGSTLRLKTTTAVRVLPEELPFKSIDPLKGPLEERSKK